MKYLDEYRDPDLARALVRAIERTAARPWALMDMKPSPISVVRIGCGPAT